MPKKKALQHTLDSFLKLESTRDDDNDDEGGQVTIKKKKKKTPEPQKATLVKMWEWPDRQTKKGKKAASTMNTRWWEEPDTVSEIIVISEKTEVPGRYMEWAKLMLRVGRAEYTPAGHMNHFLDYDISKQVARKYVSLDPTDVKVLVWWGKDYGPWIKEYEDPKSVLHKYRHFFNFSINADSHGLEKGFASPLTTTLDQLHILVNKFGPNAFNIRFGPICVYRYIGDSSLRDNLTNFESVVKGVSGVGIREIITYFVGAYPQTVALMEMRGKVLVPLGGPEQFHILDKMLEICLRYSVTLKLCCEDEAFVGYQGKLGGTTENACCYDQERFRSLKIYLDSPLPESHVCKCVSHIDIGHDYHPCTFSCDYCHSQPSEFPCPPERRDMEDFFIVQ